MVVVFGNKKGGCAKSITALNVAGVLRSRDYSVLVIDGDENLSSDKYLRRRMATSEARAENGLSKLLEIKSEVRSPSDLIVGDIRAARKIFDFIIVDTGGYISNVFKSSIAEADVVYLPFQPSKVDIEQLIPTINAITETELQIQQKHDKDFSIDTRLLVSLVDFRNRELMVEAREACKQLLRKVSLSDCIIKSLKSVMTIQQAGYTLSDKVFKGNRAHPDRAMYELLCDEIIGKRTMKHQRIK